MTSVARVLFILWLALICGVRAAEPEPFRTALLAWEPVPARPDIQRVAADLVALAQAELSSEPGIAWVERAELDKLLAEADLAASGRLDPRASLRVGKLARAQLLITGRLDAFDFAKTTLTLDAVDLERGDLLASSVTPLPPRPHKHYPLRDEDRSAAVPAIRSLLAEASARHRELAAKPAVALLFLSNSGPSSRLDPAGSRLADALRDSATAAGARVLRFPRSRDAEEENDLAVLGLAEVDDQAWRGVADLYVWGEYKERPVDGVPFEQTPVEASVTLWDGASPPRTIPWRGTVATFPESAAVFSAALRPALRKALATDPDARATAAKLLSDQAAALAKAQGASLDSAAFWSTELAANFQSHRLDLLRTAAFFDPGSLTARQELVAASWNSFLRPRAGYPPARLWRRYEELKSLAALAGRDPRSDYFQQSHERMQVLEDLIASIASRLRGEGRLAQLEMTRAAKLWLKEIESCAASAGEDRSGGFMMGFSMDQRLRSLLGDGELIRPKIDATVTGAAVPHLMLNGAWPHLAPAFSERFRSDPDAAAVNAERMVQIFTSLGREDIAYSRLFDAVAPKTRPAPKPASLLENVREQLEDEVAQLGPDLKIRSVRAQGTNAGRTISAELVAIAGTSRAECDRLEKTLHARFTGPPHGFKEATFSISVADARPSSVTGLPPDPAVVQPEWGNPAQVAAPVGEGWERPLPLTARPLHAWFHSGDAPSQLSARAYRQWPPGNRLTAPDFSRLLGFDGDLLWIDGFPLEANLNQEAEPYRLATYSPSARTLDGLAERVKAGSRFSSIAFTADEVYLASDFNGLWRLGPAPGEVERLGPEQGLPSLKLSAVVSFAGRVAVAAAAPERAGAFLDAATGRWINFTPPAPLAGGAPAAAEANAGPLLAGAGPWLLYADAEPQLYQAERAEWSESLRKHQKARSELTKRVAADRMRRIQEASASNDPDAVKRLIDHPPPIDWSLTRPAAIVADDTAFWLGGEYGLVRLDPEHPGEARLEKCPPVLALANAGPWLWVAFAPDLKLRPSNPSLTTRFENDPTKPHAAPYPANEPPEWRRSRLTLFDKASRRWLGSIEVPGGVLSLASAPGRLWAAGSDLYEIDLRKWDRFSPPRVPPPSGSATRFMRTPPHPVFSAADLGDQAALARILEAEPEAARLASGSGWTPLHAARDEETVRRLLAAGAHAGATDSAGTSPMAVAAGAGDLPSVRRLLEAGAAPSHGLARRRALVTPPIMAPVFPPPTEAPPQPTTISAELIADGTVKVAWTIPVGAYDGFLVYRRDTNKPKENPMTYRWDRGKTEWEDIGTMVATTGPAGREWIDREIRPVAASLEYAVVAVNELDRYGPSKVAVARIQAPARPAPVARLSFLSPARHDSAPLHLAVSGGWLDVVETLLAAGADPAETDAGGCTPLHLALLNGDTALARRLLAAGAPVRARMPDYYASGMPTDIPTWFQRLTHPAPPGVRPVRGAGTPLSLVYEARADRELFEALLSAGADPQEGPFGHVAVRAAALGHREEAERFLKLAPHPFVIDHSDRVAALAALDSGRHELARRLRDRTFAPDDPRWPWTGDKDESIKRRSLEVAMNHGDPEMFAWLVGRGAKPKTKDLAKMLWDAIQKGQIEGINALLAVGAKPSLIPKDQLSTVSDPKILALLSEQARPASAQTQNTSPSSAARAKAGPGSPQAALARMLFAYGTVHGACEYSPPADNVWAQPPRSVAEQTANQRLRTAAEQGDLPSVRKALDEGAKIDGVDPKGGGTALIYAIIAGRAEVVRALVDAGASLNLTAASGRSPLTFAVERGSAALVKELLDLGADPNLTVSDAHTPLDISLSGDGALTRLLLDRGADTRVSTQHFLLPIYRAARLGKRDLVELLIDHGAEPGAVRWERWKDIEMRSVSALHYAAASNEVGTLDYFISLGLDPSLTNAAGYNPLDWALEAKADRTAAKLRALGVKTREERGLPPRND